MPLALLGQSCKKYLWNCFCVRQSAWYCERLGPLPLWSRGRPGETAKSLRQRAQTQVRFMNAEFTVKDRPRYPSYDRVHSPSYSQRGTNLNYDQMVCWVLKKLIVELPYYEPAIPLPGMYPKEVRVGIRTDTYTLLLRTARFTTVKGWKQPNGPSTANG